jgi:hypothetical protein
MLLTWSGTREQHSTTRVHEGVSLTCVWPVGMGSIASDLTPSWSGRLSTSKRLANLRLQPTAAGATMSRCG